MNKWLKVGICVAIAIACAFGCHAVYEMTLGPVVAKGVGAAPQVTGAGYLTLIMTFLGSLGFSGAAGWIALIEKNVVPFLPTNTQKPAEAALELGSLGIYATLYAKATDKIERSKILEAAAILNASQFDAWFPTDAVTTEK